MKQQNSYILHDIINDLGFYNEEVDDFHDSWRTRFFVNGRLFNAEFILTLLINKSDGNKWIELNVKNIESGKIFCLYSEDSDSFESDLTDGTIFDTMFDFCNAFELDTFGEQYYEIDKRRFFSLGNKISTSQTGWSM